MVKRTTVIGETGTRVQETVYALFHFAKTLVNHVPDFSRTLLRGTDVPCEKFWGSPTDLDTSMAWEIYDEKG